MACVLQCAYKEVQSGNWPNLNISQHSTLLLIALPGYVPAQNKKNNCFLPANLKHTDLIAHIRGLQTIAYYTVHCEKKSHRPIAQTYTSSIDSAARSTDACANDGSIKRAARSIDRADPSIAPNIYILM